MDNLQTDSLVLADGALADAVLSGRMALGEAMATGVATLAWSLKHACEELYLTDAEQAARAARTLADLAQRGPDATVSALAAWAAGLARLAEGQAAPALAEFDRALAAWQTLGQALYAAQVAALRLKCWALLGRFDEAVAAAPDCEDRLAGLGDVQGAALVRLLLADLCLQQSRPDEAAGHYRDAAARFTRLDDHEHAAIAAIGLAECLVHAGQPDAAAEAYRLAEQQACQHRLPALAAAAVHGLALLQLGCGRHRAGLDGLALAQQAFSALGLDTQQAEVQRDLAAATLALNLLPEALAHHRALVQRLQGQGDAPALAWLHLGLAQAQAASGETKAARSSLAWAATLFEHHFPAGVPPEARLAQLELSLALDSAPEPARAVARQAQALQAVLAGPQRARARLLQVRAHRLAGELSASVALLPALCSPQAQAAAPLLQAQAWAEAGHAHRAQRQGVAAASAFEQALARFDDLQAALPGEAGALDTGHSWSQQTCQARLDLAVAHETPEQVLLWLHRQRVRQLQQRLCIDTGVDALDDASRRQLQALRVQHHWLRRLLQRSAEDHRPGSCAPWLAALNRVETQLLDITRRARRGRGASAVAPVADSDALDIPALARHFDQGRALVAYGETHGALLAVVVAQGRVQRVLTSTRWDLVRDAVQSLRVHLDTQGLSASDLAERLPHMLTRCTQRLQALHQLLWAPLLPALARATDVVVVPCERLQALPFAALHDGRHWLDEQCRLRMAATVTLGRVTGQRRPLRQGGGLLVDNPTSAAPLAVLPPDTVLERPSGSLPETLAAAVPSVPAQGPAGWAADTFAQTPSRPLRLSNPVDLREAVQAIAAADLLHLACPALLRHDRPAFSGLQLADGVELVPADLPALTTRLVVLGAAPPDRLRRVPGDEQLALVLAFQRAGAQEVLDSLWSVPPATAAGFLSRFQAHWNEGRIDTALAVQRARSELRALHPHPSSWAAFGLYGGQAAEPAPAAAVAAPAHRLLTESAAAAG